MAGSHPDPVKPAKSAIGGFFRSLLEFCYDCFVRLLQISELVRRESGIAPVPLAITENDLLEITITDGTGKKVRHAQRDENGRLVEIHSDDA